MHYLHTRSPPIIHRDLKSHNIFIIEQSSGHYVAKVGDWGSARAIALSGAKTMTQGVGTACWLAPETILHAQFSKDSDVYAYGILLWEVYTRKEVHDKLSAAQIIAKVAHEGLRPTIPFDCPSYWSQLMTDCWKKNPQDRPSVGNIIQRLSSHYTDEKAKARFNSGSPYVPSYQQKSESSPKSILQHTKAKSTGSSYDNSNYLNDVALEIQQSRKHYNTSPFSPSSVNTPVHFQYPLAVKVISSPELEIISEKELLKSNK